MVELAQLNPRLNIKMDASKSTQWYMNHQDPLLRSKLTPKAQKAHDEYSESRLGNSRLMEMLFKNPDIVKELVDESFFNYYLMKMGLFQLNTHRYQDTYLTDLFTTEDLYRMWQIDNALWYLQYGFCPLNGGEYPYSQRHLLRRIIAGISRIAAVRGIGLICVGSISISSICGIGNNYILAANNT